VLLGLQFKLTILIYFSAILLYNRVGACIGRWFQFLFH